MRNGRPLRTQALFVPETLKYRCNAKMPPLGVRWISINNDLCSLRLNKPAFYCFSFELPFSLNVFSQTRGKREKPKCTGTTRFPQTPSAPLLPCLCPCLSLPEEYQPGVLFPPVWGNLPTVRNISDDDQAPNGTLPFLLYPIRGRHGVAATVGV